MQSRILKRETTLYFIAFLVAVAFRFIELGGSPLSDTEAGWALQAMNVAQGTRPLLGPQPAYVLSTGLLFFFFGSTNFLARFLPALVGSVLVFVPYLFRGRLKPTRSLLLAFFLALDPGLVSLSRQAGSLIPALAFLLLAWGFWWNRRPRAAGIFSGLALLSGPAVWMGLLGLGLAWGVRQWVEKKPVKAGEGNTDEETETARGVAGIRREGLKVALLFGAGTIILGGTLFFLSPNGLSAWLDALPAFLRGWVTPSGVPGGRLLFALFVYQPLAVLFGLIAVLRGWLQNRRRYIRLCLWFFAALLLVLLYPGRQVADLAWALMPLWGLAVLELSNHLRIFREERVEVGGLALLVVVLLSFSWLAYAGIALDPQNPINTTSNAIQVGGRTLFESLPPTRYLLLISVLLLLSVSILLVALGWSTRTARLGSVWGVVIALGVYSLGSAWGATSLRTPEGWELWWPDRQPDQAGLLLTTVNDLSEWSTGMETAQEVVVYAVDSSALLWLLRERPAEYATVLDPQNAPPIVISYPVESLNLPAEYRGQDFTWQKEPSWPILNFYSWMQWSAFRTLPYDEETVIVWVRSDLFPDARPTLSP